ncbi:hypothetical protein EYF80_040472 [Liparis tanakae]|uniref:Uncharacterized protein n=1 Tax=Liparis tanakae TaxID=230148 RepID=A0A4Z2G6W5_9TELE|nr:hypothetical protein EYF80_040472 [Liparis tanakae]
MNHLFHRGAAAARGAVCRAHGPVIQTGSPTERPRPGPETRGGVRTRPDAPGGGGEAEERLHHQLLLEHVHCTFKGFHFTARHRTWSFHTPQEGGTIL